MAVVGRQVMAARPVQLAARPQTAPEPPRTPSSASFARRSFAQGVRGKKFTAGLMPLGAASAALLATATRRRALGLRSPGKRLGVQIFTEVPKHVQTADAAMQQWGAMGGEVEQRQGAPASEPEDLEAILSEAGLSFNELKDIIRYAFSRFDMDGDGTISYEEFSAACNLLSLNLSFETEHRIFMALTKGRETFAPQDIEDNLEQDLKDHFLDHVAKWYGESGLKKGEYLFGKFWELAVQEMPFHERQRMGLQFLEGHGEVIAEFLEFVAASALVMGKLQCLPDCQDMDVTDLVPLLVLMGKTAKDTSAVLDDRVTTDLSEDSAAVFATVFKPAGFTVGSFEKLLGHTGAKWVSLPAGTKLPASVFTRALGLVGSGRVRVRSHSPLAPNMSNTIAELGLGSFLGTSSCLSEQGDAAAHSMWSDKQTYVEVLEDVRLLRWDMAELQRFLAVHEEAGRQMGWACSRSSMRTLQQVKVQAEKLSQDLPMLFRDLLLSMRGQFDVEGASVWVHDRKRRAMWTLSVEEDGSVSYSEADDDTGVAGHCLSSGQVVNLADAREDGRFDAEVDEKAGRCARSMLCVPVPDAEGGAPIGVVQLVNRRDRLTSGVVPFDSALEEEVMDGVWQAELMIKDLGNRYNAA